MITHPVHLSIVILNWNNTENVLSQLRTLSLWKKVLPSIIIVDNNSEQDPTERILSSCPETIVIRNPQNSGFSGGNNTGLNYCLKKKMDYVLLLNHDASISEETVLTLITTMQKNSKIGAAGPLIREGSRTYAGGREISRHPATRIPYNPEGPLLREVPYLPGTVLLLRGETLKKTGNFDERYFFSGEVADLCLRIRKLGNICIVHTGVSVEHDIEQDTPQRERIHLYYSIRNRFLYLRKNVSPSYFIWMLFWVIYGVTQVIGAIIKRKPHSARALILAVFDGMTGRFGDRNEYFIH